MKSVLNTRIKELRLEHGMGQVALGNFVGVSQQTISRIENEKCIPPIDLIINIAQHFEVTVDYILCLSDNKRSREVEQRISKELDDYCEIISVYKELNSANRKTILILLNRLYEAQKEGNEGVKNSGM